MTEMEKYFHDNLWRFKKPIGSGAGRDAYYSKKYDCVMKKSNDRKWNHRGIKGRDQNEKEIRFFESLTEEQKEIIPIIGYFKKDGEWIILMKRVKIARELPYYFWTKENDRKYIEFRNKVESLGVGDTHDENIGWLEGKFVLIDAGI